MLETEGDRSGRGEPDPLAGRSLSPELAAAQAALLGKPMEEVARASHRRPLSEEAERPAASPEREAGNGLKLLGPFVIGLLLVGCAAAGTVA